LADQWDRAVRQLVDEVRLTGLVRELAWQGGLVAMDEGPPAVWRLRIAHESLRGSESSGRESRVEVEPGEPQDTPAQRDAVQRMQRQAQAEAVIREHPWVQSLLHQFSTARLVPGSIKPA
jgi:DNA polymerase-3 subunit gamma/tau